MWLLEEVIQRGYPDQAVTWFLLGTETAGTAYQEGYRVAVEHWHAAVWRPVPLVPQNRA